MRKSLLLFPIALIGLYFSLTSYSGGASTGSVEGTGARGTPGCGGCHGSSATSSTTVSMTLDSAGVPVTHYVAGQTYNITIHGLQTSGSLSLPRFGFQLTAVAASAAGTSSATNIGTLATSGLPASCINRTLGGSFHLVEQTTQIVATTGGGGSGTTYVESIPWTAPGTGAGTARLYGVVNAVNFNGSNDGGDKWNTATPVNITEENAPITGTLSVCVGSTTALACATAGGSWSTTATSIASVSSSGSVFGIAVGTAPVTYTTSLGASIVNVSVITTRTVGAITGSLTVCQGASTPLADTSVGGTWSQSSGTGTATISTGGVVTGLTAGTVHITYTVSNTCGTSFATRNITVLPLPTPGAITGGTTVCMGGTLALADTPSGGTWSSTVLSVASINSSGTVFGLAVGATVISYTVTNSCGTVAATQAVTVLPTPSAGVIIGPTTYCTGVMDSVRDIGASGSGTWSSSATSVATIDASGHITPMTGGTATISYSVTSGSCGTAIATYSITVNTTPHAGAISGSSPICTGTSVTFTDTSSTGTWSSSFPSIASVTTGGLVMGVSVGAAIISFTVSSATCGTSIATFSVVISPTPSAGAITGPGTVCVGDSVAYTESVTGGTWSSSAAGIASVNPAGHVLGISAGAAVITYTVTNSCGTARATQAITVNAAPSAGTISGATSVCQGATTTLGVSGASGAGTWSTGSVSIASVNSGTGVVFGVAAGSTGITYTVSNSCGLASAGYPMTVNPAPSAGTISGSTPLCVGSSAVFTSSGTAGGAWSTSAGSVASVSTSGTVSGVATGSATISYTATNSCGTATAILPVTVVTTPSAGTISGAGSVCVGSSILLSPSVSGGSWSTTTSSITSVDAGGNVYGLTVGAGVIKYTVTSSCGSAVATHNVTVNPLPVAGTISGPTGVCIGSSITLTASGTGGSWSSGSASIATVDASGNVTGTGSGTAVISYTVTNSCGSVSATYNVTSAPAAVAGTISGSSTVCQAATTVLTPSVAGGAWTTSAATTASVNTSGTVFGVAAGSATITYTVTTGCSSAFTTHTVTVNPLPLAGTISGPTTVCPTASITLTSSGTGGSWSSAAPGIATVSTGGTVTGVATTGGTALISYTVTNSCGTVAATSNITVSPLPDAGTVTGPSTICTGTSVALTYTAMFGAWSSSNPSVASVNTTGTVFGLTVGTATISYIVTNPCGSDTATFNISVSLTASAGTITGATNTCVGTSTTLTDAAGGGTWSSSATGVASVSTSGSVYGVSVGTATISYTVTTSCGTATATYSFTVNAVPTAASIAGATSVCTGANTTLTASITGGTWSTSAASVASVSSGGTVYGVSVGSATISYTITNPCGTATATVTMTVLTAPSTPAAIAGASSVCTGATTVLTDATAGGSWSTASAAVASVNSGGTVFGVTVGATVITYTVSNACGTAYTTRAMKVNTLPTVTGIAGLTSVCAGAAITLTDATTGGTWSSSATSIATVDASGNVTGVAAGTATISYSLSSVCGTVSATHSVTVITVPSAGTISGPTSVCPGITITLTDAVTGGTWSSSASSLATVSASGAVSGIAAGAVTISYGVTGVCGTGYATYAVTINPLPSVAGIVGASSVCEGSSVTYTDATTGGVWSSSAPGVATVSTSGVVTGASGGTANIVYSVTNVCGTASAVRPIIVNPLPAMGTLTGASAICVGTSTTISSTLAGGAWTASNASATVTSTGLVHGVSAGLDTIYQTFTNGCGSRSGVFVISIDELLTPTGITGPSWVCITDSIQLMVTVVGGVWSASNAHATVSSTGLVLPASAGIDTIMYSVTNGCGPATASYPVTIVAADKCTESVATTQQAEGVAVFPNPSNGTFTVVIPATGNDASITIIDVLGKVVETRLVPNASGSTSVFNLTGIASGTYLVKINSGSQMFRQSIVIY